MASKFKEGDVVQLKSGGSKMTINCVGSKECQCKWFETGKFHYGQFALGILKLADEDELPKPK